MAQTEWERIFRTKAQILKRGHHWSLEFDNKIVPDRPEPGWQQYIRNTSAEFFCCMCSRTWFSRRVMVLFHMRLMHRQGMVKVRTFGQICRECWGPFTEEPDISAENIKTLMEHLVEKIRIKCYHENLLQPNRPIFVNHKLGRPHEPDLCEACRYGICKWM